MTCRYPNCTGGEFGTVCTQECRLPQRRLNDSEIGELWFSCKLPVTETDARILIRAAENELARIWRVVI